MDQTFAHNLVFLRELKKLTQEEAAAAIGVKLKRFQAWEEGRAHPRLRFIVKICEVVDYYDVYRMLTFRMIVPPYRIGESQQ